MKTPRLDRRIVGIGVTTVVVAMAIIGALVYVGLNVMLTDTLDRLLDERAAIATSEASRHPPADLAERLTELGIRATVNAPGGPFGADPVSPSVGVGLPPPADDSGMRYVSRRVDIPGEGDVVVYARRDGIDNALRRVILLELFGLAVATAVAVLLLRRLTSLLLKPLLLMAGSVRLTSSGQFGERLHPDRPETSLGQLASAYDGMLDALEASINDAQAAHRKSERLYNETRQIIDTAAAAYLASDTSGTIIDWNRQAESIFLVPREKALGRNIVDFLDIPAVGTDVDMERLLATISHGGPGDLAELTAIRDDGHRFPVEMAMWSTKEDGDALYSVFVQDVTQRSEGQRAMDQLAAIVESAQEAIFSESLEGTILTWNAGATILYGYSDHEAIGQPTSMLVPPEVMDVMESFCSYARQGRSVPRHETKRLTRGGEILDVAVTITPIRDPRGGVVAVSTIARDLTEQRWLADTLNSTLGRLEKAQKDARAAEERSHRFLADASHQLRSPIAGVSACAETLLRNPDAGEREQLLADLVRDAVRASRLLSSLLLLARADEGQPIDPKSTDVVELCRIELERVRLFTTSLDLEIHGAKIAPAEVDQPAVREVISNLLDNARRHARERIDVTVTAGADHVEVGVENDGPPVEAELRERIFDRFVSLDLGGGSGLGLPIARELARAHGGDLVCHGNRFVLTLPVRARPRPDDAEGAPDPAAGLAGNLDTASTRP